MILARVGHQSFFVVEPEENATVNVAKVSDRRTHDRRLRLFVQQVDQRRRRSGIFFVRSFQAQVDVFLHLDGQEEQSNDIRRRAYSQETGRVQATCA